MGSKRRQMLFDETSLVLSCSDCGSLHADGQDCGGKETDVNKNIFNTTNKTGNCARKTKKPITLADATTQILKIYRPEELRSIYNSGSLIEKRTRKLPTSIPRLSLKVYKESLVKDGLVPPDIDDSLVLARGGKWVVDDRPVPSLTNHDASLTQIPGVDAQCSTSNEDIRVKEVLNDETVIGFSFSEGTKAKKMVSAARLQKVDTEDFLKLSKENFPDYTYNIEEVTLATMRQETRTSFLQRELKNLMHYCVQNPKARFFTLKIKSDAQGWYGSLPTHTLSSHILYVKNAHNRQLFESLWTVMQGPLLIILKHSPHEVKKGAIWRCGGIVQVRTIQKI